MFSSFSLKVLLPGEEFLTKREILCGSTGPNSVTSVKSVTKCIKVFSPVKSIKSTGRGVYLPDLCEKQRTNPHRAMIELLSSGAAAGPVGSENLVGAPAPVGAAPAPTSM
uniref:Uncharacterized protein n=1 Tax=Tanacetum cinerariifolium TaxID=118510 RepID=A0A699H0T3_TANCI|nr:hypothetical protein [Tanacetum cinerariifolium]